ncbi:MAG: DoxX family protein [Thermoleophilaceae bacterium]
MKLGRLIARIIIGGLFFGHGTQKLFGWFGGPGLEGTEKMMENLNLRPAKENAVLAAGAETAGGAMVALGALTPLAAAMLTGSMVTAIRKVHWPNGLWNASSGYEYNLTLIAGLAALIDGGPGKPSVDESLGIHCTGPGWTVAALTAGVAGSMLAIELGGRAEEPQQPAEASSAAKPEAAVPA